MPAFVMPPLGPVVTGIELIDIVVGLAVTLCVLAGWVFLALVGHATSHIPLIGGTVSSILDTMSHWWKRGTLNLIKGSIGQVVKLAEAAWSVVSLVWQFMFVTVGICVTLVRHLDAVAQHGGGDVAALRAQEQADIQTVDRYIEALLAKEEADVAALTGTIAAGISALNTKEQADAQAITGLQNTLRADDIPALRAQVNNLTATLNRDVLNLNNTIRGDVQTINTTINRDVTDLKAADATNLRTAENFATGLVSGLGIGAITSTLTALQGQVGRIATETTECLDPLCDTVTPQAKRLGNLGKIFQGLEDLALVAFLMAVTEEALRNPEAVVEDTVSVFNAVLGPVVDELRSAVGG